MPSAGSFYGYARQDQNQYYYDVQPPPQYQQQAVYAPNYPNYGPPVYPEYLQQPVYQGYPSNHPTVYPEYPQQPPLQPPPMYYQPPQTHQQRSSQSQFDNEYEPTMEELNWIAVEERLATYRHERKVELEEEIRQQEIAEIHRKLERLKRAQIDLIKEQMDLDLQRLERIKKKSIEIKKEKLFAQNVHSKEDEVMPATEEPKGEEENSGSVDYEQISEKSVADPMEQITLNKDISESVAQSELDEDMMDEKLQLVPSNNIVDMPTTDFIFPPCLDISIKQNVVIICSFNLPSIINTVVSSHMQNFLIKEALENKKVWSSLKNVNICTQMVRAPKRKLNSEKLLDRWRTNWKTRKNVSA